MVKYTYDRIYIQQIIHINNDIYRRKINKGKIYEEDIYGKNIYKRDINRKNIY